MIRYSSQILETIVEVHVEFTSILKVSVGGATKQHASTGNSIAVTPDCHQGALWVVSSTSNVAYDRWGTNLSRYQLLMAYERRDSKADSKSFQVTRSVESPRVVIHVAY